MISPGLNSRSCCACRNKLNSDSASELNNLLCSSPTMLTATLEENIAAFHRVFVTFEWSSGRVAESSLLFDRNGKWEPRHFLSGNAELTSQVLQVSCPE